MALRGEHVLTIVNLDNKNDVALFTWHAVVNDRDQADKILNKIKTMVNVEITLETYTTLGILRRKCTYENGVVKNGEMDGEIDSGVTDIDLLVVWSEA